MKELKVLILDNDNFIQIKKYIKHILDKGNSFLSIEKEYLKDPILNSLSSGIMNSILINYGIRNYSPSFENITYEIINLGTKEYLESIKKMPQNEIIKLHFIKIDIYTIYQYSKKLVDISFLDAKYISNDPLDCNDQSKESIVTLIQSILYMFDNNKPKNIIYLISYIFKSILVGHKLINGNKRLASMILFNFLYIFCGLFLKTATKQSKILF